MGDAEVHHAKEYTWRHPLSLVSAEDGSVRDLTVTPTISILVPVYNVSSHYLRACIESVLRQTYPFWELILCDDGSTDADTLQTLAQFKGRDTRIKVVLGRFNAGISGATNAALEMTTGDFVVLLDNDDEIVRDALLEIARAINTHPSVDFMYCDEDKIAEDGTHTETYFKPDWSPEHLESCMYVLHMMVVRRSLLLQIGGLRKEFDGSQDYDLALRLSRVASCIVHIPKILYHWRKIQGSAAAAVDAKPWALDAAKRALEDYVRTSGREGTVENGKLPGLFRVRWAIKNDARPTLVIFTANQSRDIPGRGRINLFNHFFDSILAKTDYSPGFEILVIDNGDLNAFQVKMIQAAGGRLVSYDEKGKSFNFSSKANFALSHVRSELFVLLNDDMEVISPGWLQALVEYAQLPTTGAVGAKLYYPDGRIQHCGMVLGINENVAHIYHQASGDVIGYNGYVQIVRNYLCITGACLASRLSVIDKVGGFDEDLAIDYNDVDLCLRMHASGFRNIYTPFAELYHFEGVSIERQTQNERERHLFLSRWKRFMSRDPYYNDNLTRSRLDFVGN